MLSISCIPFADFDFMLCVLLSVVCPRGSFAQMKVLAVNMYFENSKWKARGPGMSACFPHKLSDAALRPHWGCAGPACLRVCFQSHPVEKLLSHPAIHPETAPFLRNLRCKRPQGFDLNYKSRNMI